MDNNVDKEVMRVKIIDPWRTHSQIIDVVNASLGTHHTHDKVSKCLRKVEKNLAKKLEDEFGFRPTNGRAKNRASGVTPIDLFISEEYCDLPIGTIQAAAQYELDEDGYKIGPKILRHSIRLPPNPRPWSTAKSA